MSVRVRVSRHHCGNVLTDYIVHGTEATDVIAAL